MSRSQITSQSYLPEVQHCTRCGAGLPSEATFCGKCGERVEKFAQPTKDFPALEGQAGLARYRITSLIRRTPYMQLSLAIDTQQQRAVAIRDITIEHIDVSSRARIFESLQQEYDLLRQQNIDDVLPVVASFHTEEHVYSISAWPVNSQQQTNKYDQASHMYTLQDILQSGIGLPDEQILSSWILRLAHAIEQLHSHKIVIGTLDPSTIFVSQKDYSGQPALFAAWMPTAIQACMQQALNSANTSTLPHSSATETPFFAPEARRGEPEMRSDIYSLGAILYLLATGIAPIERGTKTAQQLRSPREINPRIQNTLATTILKALSPEPSARFQNISEFTTALARPQEQSKVPQRLYNALLGHSRTTEKAAMQPIEINSIADKDNHKMEKSKEAYSSAETSDENDDTVSIGHMQQQLARRYMSHAKTQRLETEQANGAKEIPSVENGHVAEEDRVSTSSPKKQILPEPEQKNRDDETQLLAPASIGTSRQKQTVDAAQPGALATKEETQQRQSESLAAVLDAPPEESTTLEKEVVEQETAEKEEVEQETVEEETDRRPSPATSDEPAANKIDEATIATIDEAATVKAPGAEVKAKQETPKARDNTIVTADGPEDSSEDDSEQTQLIAHRQKSNFDVAHVKSTPLPDHEEMVTSLAPLPSKVAEQKQDEQKLAAPTKPFLALIDRVKRFVLGGQPRINNTVAIIETPMRIQPNKNYTIRIHVMGRNEPKPAHGTKQNTENIALGGLGSLIHGEMVHIEVRSALYHNYAYIVQQTDVEVPARDYAAEVTIPMRSITDGSGTRRERLHIFFTDEKHNPLYEKPFLIELFISNLVQSGNEGHNVLSIPL